MNETTGKQSSTGSTTPALEGAPCSASHERRQAAPQAPVKEEKR